MSSKNIVELGRFNRFLYLIGLDKVFYQEIENQTDNFPGPLIFGGIYSPIACAFIWSQTTQGFKFWQDVDSLYRLSKHKTPCFMKKAYASFRKEHKLR